MVNRTTRSSLVLLGCLAVLLGLLVCRQSRALASASDTCRLAKQQLARMKEDAAVVVRLREAPRTAAARTRTNQELLAQIEKAVDDAGISREFWRDSLPHPAVRLGDTEYKREATRITLQRISMRALAAFAYQLTKSDQTLQVPTISVLNRTPEPALFDVDLLVSYLVYSPQAKSHTE